MIKAAYLANLRNFEFFSDALEREKLDEVAEAMDGFDPESFSKDYAEFIDAEQDIVGMSGADYHIVPKDVK